MSPVARRLQSEIDVAHQCKKWSPSSSKMSCESDLMCDYSTDEIRKNIITTLDDVFLSYRLPAIFIKKIEETSLKELQETESKLTEFNRELFEELTASSVAEGDKKVITLHLNLLAMRIV